jgi:hypothetical protein
MFRTLVAFLAVAAAITIHAQSWVVVPLRSTDRADAHGISGPTAITVRAGEEETALVRGTRDGNVVDIDPHGVEIPVHLCYEAVSALAADGDRVVAGCGGHVLARDPITRVWTTVASLDGTVRNILDFCRALCRRRRSIAGTFTIVHKKRVCSYWREELITQYRSRA